MTVLAVIFCCSFVGVAAFGIGWWLRGCWDARSLADAISARARAEGEDALTVARRIFPRDPRGLLDQFGIKHDARIPTGRPK